MEYKELVQSWYPSDISQAGSEYTNFNAQFLTSIGWIKEQDKEQKPWNLGKGSYLPDELSSVQLHGHPMLLQV